MATLPAISAVLAKARAGLLGHAGGTDNSAAIANDSLPTFVFHPSPAQQRLAEGMLLADLEMDVSTLCRLCNVSRAAYYRWQRNPGYVRWIYRLCSEHLDAAFPLLLMRMTNSALKGDKTAMRLIFPYLAKATRASAERNTRVGFEESEKRLNRQCHKHPESSATTAEQERIKQVGPLDQPQPEPGNVLVGPVPAAYLEYPSGYRPEPVPVTHPRYTAPPAA